MKNFLKYFLVGLLGLVLSLAFPTLKINYLIIVVAFAFLGGGLELSLIMAAALALLYSTFSLANPLWIALPLWVGVVSFTFFRRNFSLSPAIDRTWLLLQLWFCCWLFAGWVVGYSEFLWGFVTILVGTWFVPLLIHKFSSWFGHLPFFRSNGGQIDFYRSRHAKGSELTRKPFGY